MSWFCAVRGVVCCVLCLFGTHCSLLVVSDLLHINRNPRASDCKKMATNTIAAMLDELMGRDRNLAPTEQRSEVRFDDTDVCLNTVECKRVTQCVNDANGC